MYDVILTYRDGRQEFYADRRLKDARTTQSFGIASTECMRATIINKRLNQVLNDRVKRGNEISVMKRGINK